MSEFKTLYEFNEKGLGAFNEVIKSRGKIDVETIDPQDPALASAVVGTKPFKVETFSTAKEMASKVISSLGVTNVDKYVPESGLWAWLTFILLNQLIEKNKDGTWKVSEEYRWIPSNPNDYRYAHLHLVRMPVILLAKFDDDADHLLCGKVHKYPQIRHVLAGQQNMFIRSVQKAAKMLYYDEKNNRIKKGSNALRGGSVRRFTALFRQLDVTWELNELSAEEILKMLPPEFDYFKR